MNKSPAPENVRISYIAANYVSIEWNDFSNGRYIYEIQRRKIDASFGSPVVVNGGILFLSDLQQDTEYQFRIRTRVPLPSFESSDWVELDAIKTFSENAFRILSQPNVSPTQTFYTNKLVRSNEVVNFNDDTISAALISDGYDFNDNQTNISDLADSIVSTDRSQYVYGFVPFVIRSKGDVVPGSFGNILYVFHKGTREGFFSRNKGVSWTQYFPFSSSVVGGCNDGFAFKSNRNRAALVSDRAIVLGATAASEIRWSNDVIRWSSIEVRFIKYEEESNIEGGGGDILKFTDEIMFPPGISEIQCFELSDNWLFAIAGGGAVYHVNFQSPTVGSSNQIVFNPVYHQIVDGVDNLHVKSSWWHDDRLYILVTGEYNESQEIIQSEHAGVWQYDPVEHTFTRVIGDSITISDSTSSLSTDGERLILSLTTFDEGGILSNNEPYRRVYYSTDGESWVSKPERFALESIYGFFRNNEMRVTIDGEANITVIEPARQFIIDTVNTSEEFTSIGEYNFYIRDQLLYENFPGFAVGVAFYRKDNGYLIGYYNFPYRTRNRAEVALNDGLLFKGVLGALSDDSTIISDSGLPIRELAQKNGISHIIEKIAPEHYIDRENGFFGKFIETYLDHISMKDMPYGQLKNLITNKNVNTTSMIEIFESDLAARNVTAQDQRRVDLITFMKNRANDFTSAKGVAESYRWMFRALYDIDVDVFIESQRSYETFFRIETSSEDLESILPGIEIQGTNGRAMVNYVERVYVNGDLQWNVVVQDPRGRFLDGDEITNVVLDQFDTVRFEGTITRPLEIRDANPDPLSIQARARSFYIVRVSSGLSMNRWKNDVLRFVHPVGFNFIGILLIAILANTGLTLKHIETRSEFQRSVTWDSGIPLVIWSESAVLDQNGNYQYETSDRSGFPIVRPNPFAGIPINPSPEYFINNPEIFENLTTQERRKNASPLFDSTVSRFVNLSRVEQG